jgi:hypothetical protein
MGSSNPLYSFGQVLNQQFNLGSQNSVSQGLFSSGFGPNYGGLGSLENQTFQMNADRSYTEEGWFSTSLYNPTPKSMDILMQDPDITVLVKKRAFASLAENFRPDLMNQDEALFLYATKVLFQNKCQQISLFEKLSKLSKVATETGRLDSYLLPVLFSITDGISALPSGSLTSTIQSAFSGFSKIVGQVRQIVNLSSPSETTAWITNVQNSFIPTAAAGTGVMELTNVMSLNTTTSLRFGQGRFNLSLSDPYELMLITNDDVEQAIYDATNTAVNNNFFLLAASSLDDSISSLKQTLNQLRAARGVSPITFIVTAGPFDGGPQSIIAVIESVGQQIKFTASVTSVTLDASAKEGSPQLGVQGLSPNETGIFGSIVQQTLSQASVAQNARLFSNSFQKSDSVRYTRKKLRLHYANKLIIQPMDNVHVYISSKKKLDAGVSSALQDSFDYNGFMQSTLDLVGSIQDSLNTLSGGYSLEKAAFVGPDFPSWLWASFRNWFMSEPDGCHVFAGIVDTANSYYGDGQFTVSASGTDSAGYFKYGIVNIKPSVDVYNKSLYDPLTPFNIQYDSITGFQKEVTPKDLLMENSQLFQSVFVRTKNGPQAGAPASADSYFLADIENFRNQNITKVFYDPDGMVYRWKEGIASFVFDGDTEQQQDISTPALTQDPFAGVDILNIISLLIVGQPYNYATYYNAISQMDGAVRNPVTNDDPATSYFRTLQNNLKFRNLLYGNFVPFKSLTLDDQTFALMQSGQIAVQQANDKLLDLVQKRASYADKLAQLTGSPTGQLTATDVGAKNQADVYLNDLDQQIQQQIAAAQASLQSANNKQQLSVIGNDVSFDPNALLSTNPTDINNIKRRDLRRQIALFTRRLAWKVRGNQDPNFFIVDDTLDKDSDIQFFIKNFVNPETFKSDYTTVADKITNVADTIDLEVFSNSQGHIEMRPPKYNKVPSSVFTKLFYLDDLLGVQVIPQFLRDMYANQIQGSINAVEIDENKIRIYCAQLGAVTDDQCISLINGNSPNASASSAASNFMFLSSENTGRISNINTTTINVNANPDQLASAVTQALTTIQTQQGISAFSVATQAGIVQSRFSPPATLNNPTQFANLNSVQSQQSEQSRISQVQSFIQNISGQQFDISQIQVSNPIKSTDILNILTAVTSILQQRQNDIKTAANILRSIQESTQNVQDLTGANAPLSPNLLGQKSIPQIFEGLIEDETYDDLGPGSSDRYIIHNHDVLNYSISENRPAHTSVEITANFGDYLLQGNQLPSGLDIFQQGNAVNTAAAVDYDLWRMYGIAVPQPISVPTLTDTTQAATYAVQLLNRTRKNIISGTIDIIGNEYQQPGEVVYLENRDLLFYIESVTHNFNYGQGFTTGLTVGYGHNPGEYIPSPFDVIGKVLYKNSADTTAVSHARQGDVFNQNYVGAIAGNYNTGLTNLQNSTATGTASLASLLSSSTQDITMGPYGDANVAVLNSIIQSAGASLAAATANFKPVLEIRVYYNSASQFTPPNSYAQSLAQAVKSYLTGSNSLPNTSTSTSTSQNQTLSAYSSQINLVAVDCNSDTFRYPSRSAFYYGRDIIQRTSGISSTGNNPIPQTQIDQMIYQFVVDCWVVINPS